MDDEWDLHAVVKSYTTVTTGGATTATPAAAVDDDDEGFYDLENLNSENDDNPFSHPIFGEIPCNMFGGLEEVYEGGCCGQPPPSAAVATTTSFMSHDGEGFVHEQLPMLNDSHSFSIRTEDSQFIPTRKRKTQEKKMVFQLRQEELSNDTWSWRKYGQKPIKGSPYPRNYYRCSTTKACGAKKQVERSPMDPTIFIVSYSGEHIHPRPTHRNSLAGSTRSTKFSTDNIKPPISAVPEHHSCSPATTSSFSLTSSNLMEDENEMNNEEEEDDEDILIPNIDMNE